MVVVVFRFSAMDLFFSFSCFFCHMLVEARYEELIGQTEGFPMYISGSASLEVIKPPLTAPRASSP